MFTEDADQNVDEKAALLASTKSPISFLSKLGQTISRKRTPKEKKEKDVDNSGKRRKTSQSEDEEGPRSLREERPSSVSALTDRRIDAAVGNQNKVKSMVTQLLAKFEENAPAPNAGLRKQKPILPYQQRLLEQAALRQTEPLWKQASLRKEFPQNLGGSDVCYFCHRRVYVMERLSAEGKFFHRSCFKCDYCNTTLRLSCYAYDLEDGKFYCKPHYCYRRSGYSQRKRAAAPAQVSKELKGPAKDSPDAEEPGRAPTLPLAAAEKTPGPSMNGVEDHTVAKRLRATPERIELENYRVSMQKEELEEVPEETLAEHNLSSLLDKEGEDEEEAASSSSESDMDEDEEEQDEAEEAVPSSDLGGVPWNEAVKIHAKLKRRSLDELMGNQNVEPGVSDEEDDYDEEEDEDEEEGASSEEGEYCPWERELQQGLWLQRISDEDTVGTFKVGNLKLQQALSPVDPMEIKADIHWTHVHKINEEQEGVNTEGEEIGTSSPSKALQLPSHRHDPVRAWLETVSGVACEDEEAEAEVLGTALAEAEAGGDGDTSADLGDDDDIPSDAEAEERLQQSERLKLRLDEDESSDELDIGSSLAVLIHEPAVTVCSPKAQNEKVSVLSPKERTSPSVRFFPEPYILQAGSKATTPLEPKGLLPLLPVCSQPTAKLVTPTSPVKSPSIPPLLRPLRSPTSPIRSQPLPSTEAVTVPTTTKPPVCLQPSPLITSTPLAKLPFNSPALRTNTLTSPSSEEALKRIDLIEEFWTKSAEIRRSLGLTPAERSRPSEVSFPSLDANAPRSLASKTAPVDMKSPLLKAQHVLKKVNPNRLDVEPLSPLTPISPSEKELKSSEGERRDMSTSSGLGLNGSNSNTRTVASESFNTSDSALLTPPSSPPPPPPQGEEPATLQRSLASWQNGPESIPPPPTQTRGKSPDAPQPPPKLEEIRKSFVESVDEIPFADDVEDTYDERTDNSSFQERFFTPPTSRGKLQRLPLTKENGELPCSLDKGHQRKRLLPQLTPEAKELAEERMRVREKSVKSAALRDAMAQQLNKMKQLETMQASHGGSVLSSTNLATHLPVESRALPEAPTLRLEALDELFLSPLPAEDSVTSSEGSGGGKPKKRPSLFSPRKKEKKSKGETSRLSDKADDGTKPKSLWKSVFSGYKKEKKKKSADGKSTPSTPSSTNTVDYGKVKAPNVARGAELPLRRHLSFSEDSDLSSDDVLEKSTQKSKRESVYVPHALAFRRSYSSKKAYTEEELNAKLTKRVQKAARRQAKQEELKRLHRAQIIQRQLEQVEEKQRQLEEHGVAVEKALRGEAVDPIVGTPRRRPISFCPCCVHEGNVALLPFHIPAGSQNHLLPRFILLALQNSYSPFASLLARQTEWARRTTPNSCRNGSAWCRRRTRWSDTSLSL
ncbi:hypothetical protein GDO78_016363 [Eleutherodactylus coqui]|uniref:LIM zinc-binding domain-containing protein n=1 Tax=Eleutherodactylus coqui TaxID=57060 RepID=A0A8J6BMH3_ELECQ|nr:hypothetical protein GDO78_016363 [Eleutherodactylus coqui]